MDEVQSSVVAALDEELGHELVQMTSDLVDIPSPTGEEGPIADYVAARFEELGLDVELQEVEPGRNNVVARLKGGGNGRSLLLNAHFDTSTTGEERGLPFGYRPRARVVDGWIYGLGVSNMKAVFAAYYGAIRMLRTTGIELAGDVSVVGVVGEIEKAPIDEHSGNRYRGGGVGTMYAAHHGIIADAAIIGEPTGLRLQLGNTSYAFARITSRGVPQHTWSKERGVDPIVRITRVMDHLRAWEPIFEKRHPHPRMGSRIGIGAIQGGYPSKPSICPPPSCSIYVDFRFPPDVSILELRREIEDVLGGLQAEDPSLATELDFYLIRSGSEVEPDEPVAVAVRDAHRALVGSEPDAPDRYRYAVSADCSILDAYGIPSITYGPGGLLRDGTFGMYDENGEILSIENLYTAAKTYALSALQLCGVASGPV